MSVGIYETFRDVGVSRCFAPFCKYIILYVKSQCCSVYSTCNVRSLCALQHHVFIPSDWPSLTVEANQAFNLTSFALSLLLVFRSIPARSGQHLSYENADYP